MGGMLGWYGPSFSFKFEFDGPLAVQKFLGGPGEAGKLMEQGQ